LPHGWSVGSRTNRRTIGPRRALAVHVLYAKVDDEGALGRGGRGARGPCVQLALRRDREHAAGRSQLGIFARMEAIDGDAGDLLVEVGEQVHV